MVLSRHVQNLVRVVRCARNSRNPEGQPLIPFTPYGQKGKEPRSSLIGMVIKRRDILKAYKNVTATEYFALHVTFNIKVRQSYQIKSNIDRPTERVNNYVNCYWTEFDVCIFVGF